MKNIGDIIGQLNATSAVAPSNTPAEPRVHRVSLSIMIVAEVEVMAVDARTAMELAVKAARTAKRKYRTAPYAYRTEVVKYKDPATGEIVWVEIDAPGA